MADIETTVQQGGPEGEPALNPDTIVQTSGTEQPPAEADQSSGPDEAQITEQAGSAEKPRTPWFQRRIDDLTKARRDAERERDAYRQMVEAMRSPSDEPAPQPQQPVGDIETLATARAREIVREQSFNTACNDAYAKGSKEYGDDFVAAVDNLRLAGVADRRDIIEAVIDSGAPERVLYALGKDPDRAAGLLALSPTKLAFELVRIANTPPPSKPVSSAPPPIKPVTGSAKPPPDEAAMSTDEWMAWRNKQVNGR